MTLRTNFNFRQQLHRRTLLKGAGVSMAMPWLSAMESSFGAPTKKTPRRFVAMTLGLGLLADNLNPKQTGREYQSSAYLKDFDDLRKDFTVVSGTSHPGVGGGHRAESSLLVRSADVSRNSIRQHHFSRSVVGEASWSRNTISFTCSGAVG